MGPCPMTWSEINSRRASNRDLMMLCIDCDKPTVHGDGLLSRHCKKCAKVCSTRCLSLGHEINEPLQTQEQSARRKEAEVRLSTASGFRQEYSIPLTWSDDEEPGLYRESGTASNRDIGAFSVRSVCEACGAERRVSEDNAGKGPCQHCVEVPLMLTPRVSTPRTHKVSRKGLTNEIEDRLF